jgi:hypothetical protein
MDSPEITVTFGPAPGDPSTLSKAHQKTLHALYRHPIAHNLEWKDVVSLFEALGTVDQGSHNETSFDVGGARHAVRKPHNKDLSAAEVMEFRHILSRAGWSPESPRGPAAAANASGRDATAGPAPPDLLVVVDHHEARIYQLDLRSADLADHVIRPYDPHHFLHHLAHKDQSRERGQRAPEDHTLYERIAQAVAAGGGIVLVGHGKGHANAAHHLAEHLRTHHAKIHRRVAHELEADLSSVTPPQLLELARRALSVA